MSLSDIKSGVATPSPTRGRGLLEARLAQWRARQANRLISNDLRQGRILDIGCGSYPYFLAHTSFKEKFAIDQVNPTASPVDIRLHQLDLNTEIVLPFADGFFRVVTMLAVVEHLNPARLVGLLREAHRILEPSGLVIVTTPCVWSAGVLRAMACLGLVSADEIREHTCHYSARVLGSSFGIAGFSPAKVRCGYFELFFNLWATAQR